MKDSLWRKTRPPLLPSIYLTIHSWDRGLIGRLIGLISSLYLLKSLVNRMRVEKRVKSLSSHRCDLCGCDLCTTWEGFVLPEGGPSASDDEVESHLIVWERKWQLLLWWSCRKQYDFKLKCWSSPANFSNVSQCLKQTWLCDLSSDVWGQVLYLLFLFLTEIGVSKVHICSVFWNFQWCTLRLTSAVYSLSLIS